MKKKSLSVLLATAMLATLSACGGSAEFDDPMKSPPPAEEEVQESTSPDGTPGASDETMGLFKTSATIEETVLVDEGGVKITATGLTYTNYSVDLALTIENNSGKNLSFVTGSLGYSCNSVNGY